MANIRQAILNRDPFCKHCLTEWSEEVDHKIPLGLGGKNVLENLQGLCKLCHRLKTLEDMRKINIKIGRVSRIIRDLRRARGLPPRSRDSGPLEGSPRIKRVRDIG